jgi:hypothetical protein
MESSARNSTAQQEIEDTPMPLGRRRDPFDHPDWLFERRLPHADVGGAFYKLDPMEAATRA